MVLPKSTEWEGKVDEGRKEDAKHDKSILMDVVEGTEDAISFAILSTLFGLEGLAHCQHDAMVSGFCLSSVAQAPEKTPKKPKNTWKTQKQIFMAAPAPGTHVQPRPAATAIYVGDLHPYAFPSVTDKHTFALCWHPLASWLAI